MLAFLNTPTFPVFSPPTYFNPAFILRFYLSFIFYLAFIYCVLLFTNIIYHVMRTDTCNKPHTLRDAVTGRNRNSIICLKSVCLSGDVRRITLAIVAQSPREMSQTDRIHPRYFLLQIRVSIRRRIFVYA